MPTYRIIKPYNSKVKEGDLIEMESLHPSLVGHVILAGGDTLRPVVNRNEDEDEVDPRVAAQAKAAKALTPAKLDKLHEDAIKIDAALFPVEA